MRNFCIGGSDRKIVVIGDDFGFSEGINRAFVECYSFGILQECSLMIDSFGTRDAINLIRQHNIKHVGIHVSLFRQSKGQQYPHSGDYENMLAEKGVQELSQMILDELELFEKMIGRKPTHITGHQSLHLHPKILPAICEYASNNKTYIRVRECDTKNRAWLNYRETIRKIDSFHITRSDNTFALIFGEQSEDEYINQISQTQKDATVELFFHPGYVGEFERLYTSFITEREHDRKLLLSNSFKEKLLARGSLTNCSQLSQI